MAAPPPCLLEPLGTSMRMTQRPTRAGFWQAVVTSSSALLGVINQARPAPRRSHSDLAGNRAALTPELRALQFLTGRLALVGVGVTAPPSASCRAVANDRSWITPSLAESWAGERLSWPAMPSLCRRCWTKSWTCALNIAAPLLFRAPAHRGWRCAAGRKRILLSRESRLQP